MQGGEDATKKQQNDFLRNQKILFDCTPHILADKMPFLAELICSFSIKKGLGFILPGWKAGGVSSPLGAIQALLLPTFFSLQI